jgi:hypothetical protein
VVYLGFLKTVLGSYRKNWYENRGVKGYHEGKDGDSKHHKVFLLEWLPCCWWDGIFCKDRVDGNPCVIFGGFSHNYPLTCGAGEKKPYEWMCVDDEYKCVKGSM